MNTSIPAPTQIFPKKSDTPQLLRSGWYATWVVSFLLLVASISGVGNQRQALKTVGKDAAPSILTAQQLRDSFANIDASLANELLLKPGQNQQALLDFDKNSKKIADRLLAASKNINYLEQEQIVQGLQRNSIDYFLKVQEARDFHKLGNAVNALNVYRTAANIVDRQLLPQAQRLDDLNSKDLENSYSSQGNINKGIMLSIAILGFIQIGILVAIQLFLYRRMNRILNLHLFAASAIGTVFFGYTLISFTSAFGNLKIAKEDAFDSLHALRQMRSLSYMANGDESRYLLDAVNATKHEKSLLNNITQIVKIPTNLSTQQIISNIQQDSRNDNVGGLFGLVLNDISFPTEKELMVETFQKFDNYLTIDKQVRQLYRAGKVPDAIALRIGNERGQLNSAFDLYRNAQTHLIDLNKIEFDRHIKMGEDGLANFEVIAIVALGGVAILTLFGLRPRLMEYL
jgi:hypothetical protein